MKEAILLAGGLGTRLKSAVPDLPKCMAPVNGHPFIYYLVTLLQQQGIEHFIFALGYKSEMIITYLENSFPNLSYQLSIEDEPLGTGGAIKQACTLGADSNVLVANGDTLFKVDISALSAFHQDNNAHCTLSLKPMKNFSRYGVVELDENRAVQSFREKAYYTSGLINGGVYALQTNAFLQEQLPQQFSFEKDYLEALYTQRRLYGFEQDGYFIDIGIPEDYNRAQEELK